MYSTTMRTDVFPVPGPPVIIKKGERIAQAIFNTFTITDDDKNYDKDMRNSGFGSTGK